MILEAVQMAFVLGVLSAGPPDLFDEPPFSVSGFALERMRKDASGAANRVSANFLVQVGEVPVKGLSVKIDYTDYSGKVLASAGPSRLGDLAPLQKKQCTVSGTYIPLFNGYIMSFTGTVQGRNCQWQFFGASSVDSPTYLPPKPIPKIALLVVMASDLEQSANSPRANLHLRVRNLGALPARDAACYVEVLGKDGKPLGKRVRAPLTGAQGGRPGVVNGGEERVFTIQFARFPQFENFSVELDWKSPPPEEALSGGEFTGAKEVELAQFAFKRDGNSLEISGVARNGLDHPIERLRIVLKLLERPKSSRKSSQQVEGPAKLVKLIEHTLPGNIAPGAKAPFRVVATDVGGFDDFEYEVRYDEPGQQPERTDRTSPFSIEVEQAVRLADGSFEISGTIEHTGPALASGVELMLSLIKADKAIKEHIHKFAEPIPLRKKTKFVISIPNCPDFDEYLLTAQLEPSVGVAP